MDPVKEKLLLLKKLANEKKANQNSSNNENNSNNNNNNLHESSSKLEVESSSASSSAAVALAEDNTNTSNIISSSTNEKNKRAREQQQQQQQQKQQQENQQKHQEENKEAVKKSNLNNNSSSTNKNSSNNSKSTNNSNKLNVVEDHLTTATGEEASEGEETAADESSFVVAPEDNTKKQKTAETNTMNSQNRSAVNEPKDNNASSAFKYISRMKHLYDRERASSTESINSTRQPLPASAAFMQRKKPQAVLSPQSSLLGRGGDEIISDQDDQSSIMTSSNAGGNAPRSNKYIKHLMDSFNSGQAPTRLTADSPNETKRNSIGETAMSSTQIDRIKEKFAKMNNIQENNGSQSSKRHSTMFGGHNQDRAPVLANYMNSALSKSLKSLNTIDLGDMGGRIAHGNSVMSMSMSMQPHEANIVAAPSSKRAMNKYQKSITCDLSSYILGGNKQEEEQTTPTNSTRIVANDSDYDSLFDRFSGLDAKYMPENAIIRSTLSTSNANPTINKHREQHQNQDYHSIPTIITTDATPTSKPQTPFSFPTVQQPQQQPQQTIKRPVHLQQPQQVKSILKSPSSTSEKSIHFDDHIDVIQIEDRLSTATSSPPSTSQPPEQDTDNPSSTTTSTAIEQPPQTNLELFKPLKGISQTEMAKNMLFHQTKASSQQPQLPPHHFSNEIEAIKKMLLEPISITRQNDLVPEYAALNRAKSSGNGNGGPAAQRTSRVFIKSPTPMRELPNYQDAQDANKNRNRFTKKKLSSSLRSQSADFNDSLVAEEIDDQIIDDGRRDNFPVPHHLRVSPMPSASNNNRPNLTRQNALGKHASRHQQQQQLQYQQQTTKSLSENLNFAHYYHQSPPKLDPAADPSKPPKSALTNRLLAKLTTNKHGRHGHRKSKKSSSRNRHSNRGGSSKHQNHKNKKRQFERSSSLTDSSQSESDLTESDLSTASSSSSASSEEQNARAHSDSFLSSSANTSLDDLAQLNNELLRADDRNTHLQPPHHHSNQPSSDRLLPPKQKKRTPVFNVFDKTGAGKQQQKSSHHKRSGNQVASNQQQLSRHTFYSSDDSVCGIPKPSSKLASSSRLCSSGKPFHKSMDELSGGYNRVETSTSTIPKAQTIATKSSTTGSTSQQQYQQQQSTMSNLLTSGRSRVHNHPGTQIATLTNNKTSTTSRAENKENNNNKHDDDDEKYPSFDDQDSHLSRNPTSLLSHNTTSSSHNNTNKLAAHQHLFYPSTHHQTHQNNELYFNKPSTTPLSTINNELYNNTTTTVKSPPRLQQPQQEMTFERKPSTESSKSSQQQKKPLPSYSQLVQSNPNAFQFYQQQPPQPQKQPARYDNNLVPVGGGNTNSSFANGLYSLNDPNRIVQPYQHNLLNQSSSVARDSFLSPPRQTSYHQNQQQQSYAGPNYPSSHHHPNESMLAFQQSRSRSLDANMYYDAHPEVLSKYVEDEQQPNLINDHHDYSNNIRSSMPSQSLAIQEKLKMFEQTSPPPSNTTVQQQNSNIFDVNSGITGRKLYQPSTTAATSIQQQQQQQYNDQIVGYPQQQATKRNSFEPTSTTATSTTNNNKENSPYNYKMMTMPASTQQQQQQQQQQQRYNYYQQPQQQQRPYNPASIEPTFHSTTTNKFPSLIDTSNVIERSSPPKSASNTYKYGGSKTTSANNRSSGFINPSLAAATAAAAAALNAVTGTQTLDFGTNSGSSSSGASRSKMMRQDSGNNFTPSMQYSAYEGRSPSQNLNEMSSNSNSAKIVDQQKEKSMEKVLLMQTPPNVFKNQPQYNRDSLIDTTTASLSLNSTNNNANNNELPKKRVFYDNRPQTNSITFTKSNVSPTKVATSALLPSQQQQQQQQLNTTIDDIEMLSSSPSSTSSLKEAIRQKQMTINNNPGLIGHNHHSNKHLTVGGGSVDMTVSSISGHTTTSSVLSSASGASGGKDHRRNSDEMIGEQYMENNEEMSNENNGVGENRDEEPSKLSLSEKMKLFSNSSALAAGLRPKYAAANQNVVAAASGAKFNRFQTQPISSADLDYANKLATTNNNNNNKFLTSIENNIHMINTNNNNNNTNTKTSSSLTTPTTPKLDNHHNQQSSNNNNNSFKRFIDTNGNTKDSSIAPSNNNNNNNNNAISSSTAPAKTITLFKSQTTKLQHKIINDNHQNKTSYFYKLNGKNLDDDELPKRKASLSSSLESRRALKQVMSEKSLFSSTNNNSFKSPSTIKPSLDSAASKNSPNRHYHQYLLFKQPSNNCDKTSSKMSSNETAAIATTTATTNAEPNEEVVIDEESSSKQAEQPQQQREPKRYKFKSKTDVVTKTNESGGVEQRTETTTASLEETNENSRPPTAGEPTSVAQLEIGMTIQERMAALKKIGEESNNSWKRRPVAATGNTVEPPSQINTESSQPNIVKQQKEQIQLQLKQMLTTTKSKMQAAESKQQSPRNVLSALDDNNNQHENADLNTSNVKPSTAAKQSDHDLFMSKKALIEKRVLFTPPEQHHVRLTKPTSPEAIAENTKPKTTSSRVHKHSGSDTDTMYTRNASLVGQQQQTTTKNERVELFSTDSEMDSFFKENENILQQQNFLSSSSTTTGGSNNKAEQKTDDNTMNDDESFDDVEFDRLVTEANRLTQRTRAKPSRKTKSKGNHLKNLQNRMEIKNEYEQQSRVSVVSNAPPTVLKSSVSPTKSTFNN